MYSPPMPHQAAPAYNDPLTRSFFTPQLPSIPTDIQSLTRQAFAEVTGFQPEAMQRLSRQHIHVFNSVAKALQRAMADPSFAALPLPQQLDAATSLTRQCQQAVSTMYALQDAMNNPATMAHQLMANAAIANGIGASSVFNHIVLAHLPSTQINAATVMQYGRLVAPQTQVLSH